MKSLTQHSNIKQCLLDQVQYLSVSNLILFNFKKVFLIGKLKSGKSKESDDDIPMTEEDKKLFELTKNNTIVNRDILNKEKEYLKNMEQKYKELYGDKGLQFCEEENTNNSNEIKNENQQERKKIKRKTKVQFSSIVEYTRI